MKTSELVGILSKRTQRSKASTQETLKELVDVIVDAVSRGERVHIPGLGVFKTSTLGVRQARNPATGAIVQVAGKTRPKFSPAEAFRTRISASQDGLSGPVQKSRPPRANKTPTRKGS